MISGVGSDLGRADCSPNSTPLFEIVVEMVWRRVY